MELNPSHLKQTPPPESICLRADIDASGTQKRSRGREANASNRGAERRAVHKEAINIEPRTVAREVL